MLRDILIDISSVVIDLIKAALEDLPTLQNVVKIVWKYACIMAETL